MLRSEIPIFGPNVLKLPRCWIDYLDITSDVLLSIDFAELAEGLVGDLSYIKFVIACTSGQSAFVA